MVVSQRVVLTFFNAEERVEVGGAWRLRSWCHVFTEKERDEKQRLIFGVKEKSFEIFAGSLRKVSVRQSTSLTNLLSMQVPSLEYKHKIRGWAAM